METPSKKPRRKENWCKEEIEALRCRYFDFSSCIEEKLRPCLTGAMKDATWKRINERVNSQGKGTCVRSIEECKKKLSDATEVKRRELRRRQMACMTGGGPAPQLDEWEKVINLIGESAIGGFQGVETFRLGTCESSSSATTTPLDNILQPTAQSYYVEDSSHTDYNVAVAMLPIEAAIGEIFTTPIDSRAFIESSSNKSNVGKLLERQK